MKLSSLAINRPVSVVVLLIAASVLGVYGLTRLPVNLLPDITYPMVKVYINWRGATPQEIEDNIATVVERRMATVDGLDYMESQCTEGMYALVVNFDYNVDRDVAYQDVLSKMGLVKKNLPKDIDEPYMFKADPSNLPVVDLAISSNETDITKLRSWVENVLQDEFATVKGAAGSEISGGKIREIRVNLDQKRMQYFGLTAEQVTRKLQEENIQLMGGRVTGERREWVIRTLGEFASVGEIGKTVISSNKAGGVILLKDIAKVEDSADEQRVITRLNGRECVKLSILKQAGANTVEVENGVRKKMAELEGSLPEGVRMGIIYNQADYIKASVSGVRDAAIMAAILIILVTAFFLNGWRRILIVSITIPVTVLLTFFVTQLAGFSLNIFSLAGLVIAIALILDDCVVVIENITRIRSQGGSQLGLTELGINQVASAVAVATVTFLALFVPFLLVPGLVSLLFRELILTIAVAVGISLIVALTATPTLYKLMYPEDREPVNESSRMEEASDKALRKLLGAYHTGVYWSTANRKLTIGITLALFIIGLFFLKQLGSEFLPEMDDGQIMVKVKMPTGTSVTETARVLGNIEGLAKDLPGVERYSSLAGGHMWGMVTYENAHEGEVNLQLVPRRGRKMSTSEYVNWLSPQVMKSAATPGARIKVMHAKIKGIRTIGEYDIEAEMYVPRSETMEDAYELSTQVLKEVKDTPGLANPDISIDISKPEYQVSVDRERAADLGLSVGKVTAVVTDKCRIDADLVLMAIGVRPNVKLACDAGLEIGETGAIKVNQHLQTSDPDIYAGGDCVENINRLTGKPCYVPLGSTANKHGRVIGDNVTGGDSAFPGVLGTVIFKAFDFNVARVGLSEKDCIGFGIPYLVALTPGPDRAHYYPTAKPMVLKLISNAENGKLLGVQAVGMGDVAKRIDVAATALSYGAATRDLAELDLAYAPPYSSAVDLLAHASNVIDNKSKGVASAISPAELKTKLDAAEDFVLLDVRSPQEVEAAPFNDSRVVNIPLGKLRVRLAELPKDKEIVAFCKISVRGYEAQRVLNGEGFDNVRFLDGGIMAWPYSM